MVNTGKGGCTRSKIMRTSGLLAVLLLSTAGTFAQVATYAPPPAKTPPQKTLEEIRARTEKLAGALEHLRNQNVRDPALAEIEIYHKAALWTLRHNEFYNDHSADWTLDVLDRGLLRASQQARGETPWWGQVGQSVVRAYRSRVDGSVQPYAVTFPTDYATDKRKRYRLDIVLHGRQNSLTEVSFLHDHRGDRRAPKEQTWVQIDIYGRGNNAYRWAGETDVWEVLDHFLAVEGMLGRAPFLDASRVVLRGFSMGGAGTWHIGLHRPDAFAVIGPGAGFTTTLGYVAARELQDPFPDYQRACLHIYDAVDYAENARDVPIVAYAGEKDAQLQAARNIEARLKPLGIPMTLLVAPELGHSFPKEWQQKAEAEYEKHLARERSDYPNTVQFVTWTLKYPSCNWVEILGMDWHYQKASVHAERNGDEGFTIKTANVRQLHLNLWRGSIRSEMTITIDGQKIEKVRPSQARTGDLHFYLDKREGKWGVALPERLLTERLRQPQKVTGLQGPIDDAFTAPFLCVRGTGEPWNPEVARYAQAALERFRVEWSKYLRGDLPVKDDVEVSADDLAGRHLILFGDPGSNSLIAQVLPGLPFRWTRKEITWGGKSQEAANHVPVLIYPSPLAPDRYVVLNSGHTFHAYELERTNALLFPRLGDHALLKLVGGEKDPLAVEVTGAGLFDDFWRATEKP
jgi:dienelactone hydrolase